MKNLLINCLALLFFTYPVFGQDFKIDMQRINKVYTDNPSLSMDLVYKYYSQHNLQQPEEVQRGSVKKSGEGQLYKLASVEILTNRKYTVYVDNDKKIISIGNKSKQQSYLPIEVDSLIKMHKNIEYFQPNENQGAYKITTERTKHERVEIYFNRSTYAIEKMVIYFKESTRQGRAKEKKDKPKMEIYCENINLNPKFSKGTFSEKKYIKQLFKDIQLQPEYTGFKILSTLK